MFWSLKMTLRSEDRQWLQCFRGFRDPACLQWPLSGSDPRICSLNENKLNLIATGLESGKRKAPIVSAPHNPFKKLNEYVDKAGLRGGLSER